MAIRVLHLTSCFFPSVPTNPINTGGGGAAFAGEPLLAACCTEPPSLPKAAGALCNPLGYLKAELMKGLKQHHGAPARLHVRLACSFLIGSPVQSKTSGLGTRHEDSPVGTLLAEPLACLIFRHHEVRCAARLPCFACAERCLQSGDK